MTTIVAKISGKIVETKDNLELVLNQFKTILKSQDKYKSVLLIPGGGSYANFIRKIDHKISLNQDTAHWEAIYAMEFNAQKILMMDKKIHPIYSPKNFLNKIQKSQRNGIFLFFPFEYLYQEDDLPHSWEVTSDSIAIHIAKKINTNECFLIKDVDGIIDHNGKLIQAINSNELKKLFSQNLIKKFDNDKPAKKSQPIDHYILELINKYNIRVVMLNGSLKNSKIIHYFGKVNNRKLVYTEIFPS